MTDMRHKDANWTILADAGTGKVSFDQAQLAVLMDIRDELKDLNRTLRCWRIQDGFDAMRRLDRRLAKRISLRPKKKPA